MVLTALLGPCHTPKGGLTLWKVSLRNTFLNNQFLLLSSFNMHTEIVLKTSMKGQMQIYQLLRFIT